MILPLPNDSFDGAIVVASVWLNDDEGLVENGKHVPIHAILLLLRPVPNFYEVVKIEKDNVTNEWRISSTISRESKIVPAVEAYIAWRGDY